MPHAFLWVIIHNSDYEERRKIPGNEGFQDLPEADKDAVTVRKAIRKLGARPENIIDLPDASYDDLKEQF